MAQGQEVVVPEGGSSGGFSIEITLKPLTKTSYRKAGTMSNIRSALVKGDRGEEMPRQKTVKDNHLGSCFSCSRPSFWDTCTGVSVRFPLV